MIQLQHKGPQLLPFQLPSPEDPPKGLQGRDVIAQDSPSLQKLLPEGKEVPVLYPLQHPGLKSILSAALQQHKILSGAPSVSDLHIFFSCF